MTEPQNQGVCRCSDGRFAPGHSGNPGGKRAGTVSLKALLERKMAERPEGVDQATFAEQVVKATLTDAVEHDGQSRKLVWEYLEGRPRQSVEVDMPPGGAVLTIAETVSLYASTFALVLEGEAPEG